MAKKYYWLKLKRDFLKRHDIQLMRSQEDGDRIVLFYMMLLLESVDHEGRLRYSEEIPYTEDDLSTVTSTLQDVTRNAMQYLIQKKLIIVEDDGTFFLPKASEMIGSESRSAERVRRYRAKNKGENEQEGDPVTDGNKNVTESKSKEIDKELEFKFDQFWSIYPKKVAKAKAKKSFEKAIKNKDCPSVEKLIEIIEILKLTDNWTKEKGQYIPHASTWLNQERWNDELQNQSLTTGNVDYGAGFDGEVFN